MEEEEEDEEEASAVEWVQYMVRGLATTQTNGLSLRLPASPREGERAAAYRCFIRLTNPASPRAGALRTPTSPPPVR